VRQKKDGLPAVPERLRLEVLDFDLLKRPLTLTETLFEGLIMDTVAAGHIECPSDGDVARCRQVLADYWKLSHNDQGDFHQLQTFLSHFGSLYPTHKLLLDSATNKKLLKQLPGRARLLPQAVFTGVVCSFYEPSGFSHQNEGTKCDVFVFTDSIWFFRAKKSTLEKLNKAHYRCRSGEQHFLLLREDIAAVQEIGGLPAVIKSHQHRHAHVLLVCFVIDVSTHCFVRKVQARRPSSWWKVARILTSTRLKLTKSRWIHLWNHSTYGCPLSTFPVRAVVTKTPHKMTRQREQPWTRLKTSQLTVKKIPWWCPSS